MSPERKGKKQKVQEEGNRSKHSEKGTETERKKKKTKKQVLSEFSNELYASSHHARQAIDSRGPQREAAQGSSSHLAIGGM
jgi:hypothetical protein